VQERCADWEVAGSVKYLKRRRREEGDSTDDNTSVYYHNINALSSEDLRAVACRMVVMWTRSSQGRPTWKPRRNPDLFS